MTAINAADAGVLLVLLVSAGFAYLRGFAREVMAIGAWVGAALVALYGFHPARPYGREYITPEWLADGVTALALFLVSLVVLSLVSHAIAIRVRGTALSAVDRALGFLFGIARGAFVVVAAYMLYAWAVPPAEQPSWLTSAKLYPTVRDLAGELTRLLPREARAAVSGRVGQAGDFERAREATFQRLVDPPARSDAGPAKEGYDQRQRRDLDRLIDSNR